MTTHNKTVPFQTQSQEEQHYGVPDGEAMRATGMAVFAYGVMEVEAPAKMATKGAERHAASAGARCG